MSGAIGSTTDATMGALSASREDADRNLGSNPVGAETTACSAAKPADEPPKIVAVEYLNGDDKTELSGEGKHFVNLSLDAKWVDTTNVANIDRLSRKTRIKVRFNKPGAHSFKVKYVADPKNALYTPAEKGRNTNFLWQEAEKSYTTDGNGTKIIAADFFVTAAGGDKYKLVAQDTYGTPPVHSGGTVKTQRLVYLKEIKMAGLASIASSLSTFIAEYASRHIVLVQLASVSTTHMANIGSESDVTTFKNQSRAAYTASDAPAKEPYVIAVGYTDHLAVKNASKQIFRDGVNVGPKKPDVDIAIRGTGLRAGDGMDDRYLWKNLVPGEDWFVSATYLRTGGTAGTDDVVIPAAKCTAVPVSAAKPDMCRTVRVDVTGLPAGTGRITLVINWVDRMRAGLASSGNLIIICTRSWWENESMASQNQVMVHEMGHKTGMVADGSGPDRVTTQYDNKGHVGSHCHNGVPEQASYAGASGSICVMFGETNGLSAFCANCAPAVRKEDLSAGWSRF